METLKRFKQFVDEINLENGRNYKLSVLEKYKDDEVIKKYLQYVFDPFNVFGIAEKKLNKSISRCEDGIASVFGILDYLLEHNTGRDYDVAMTLTTRDILDEDLKNLFDKIITKNLILGISGDTINKIFGPDTIKKFSVQLANKYFDMKPGFLDGKTFVLTTKIDGMRCVMMKENGNVTFWSRQGQPIEGLVDLEEDMKQIDEECFALDGELVADLDNPDTYKTTMKLARKTTDMEKHGLKMKVFDMLPGREFQEQYDDFIYSHRRQHLEEFFNRYNFHYFELLPVLYQGTDTNKIEEILKEQVANGEEGIMINIVDAPYEFKRTNNLLKVKLMQTLDLEIVDYFEGNDTFAGMLGGFIVRYKDNNLIRVGSGFEKDLREEIWKDPESYIGKIIEVQYFEETENANGGKSIRFPVFKDFRTDKIEADY